MNVLIVSATKIEVAALIQNASKVEGNFELFAKEGRNSKFYFLITGVGMVATTYTLTKVLSLFDFSFVINVGIAGTYNQNHSLGEVFNVQTESFGDLGLMKNHQFYNLSELNLLDSNAFPFKNGKLINYSLNNNTLISLKATDGITVNLISNDISILQQRENLGEIESMEGAAIFYVCLMENIPFAEIRSISNYAGEMDKSKWNIPLAIKILCETVEKVMEEITYLR